MPKYTMISGCKVATEEELLRFANVVRQAGGANPIEALLPSRPEKPSECLIANALNFSCSVNRGALGYHDDSYEFVWYMEFPYNMDEDRIREIAKGAHCRVRRPGSQLVMQLPRHIGNAAWAFDRRLAFQDYNELKFHTKGYIYAPTH